MINISQHLFVPTVQYVDGYYNASGRLISQSQYSTVYPIQSYPTSDLVNSFMVFSNTSVKLRSWSSETPSSQSVSSYSPRKGVPTSLTPVVLTWAFPVLRGEFAVQLLFWKEFKESQQPVGLLGNSSFSELDEEIEESKSVTEEIESLLDGPYPKNK